MGVDKIWVLAEASEEGAVKSTTLELLTKARELSDTVEAVFGGDGDDVAEELGEFGAATVHATGDLDGQLMGIPVASAIADAVEAGDGPDAILIGTSYDGRDVAARLSVMLDRTVISNVVDIEADDEILVSHVRRGEEVSRLASALRAVAADDVAVQAGDVERDATAEAATGDGLVGGHGCRLRSRRQWQGHGSTAC